MWLQKEPVKSHLLSVLKFSYQVLPYAGEDISSPVKLSDPPMSDPPISDGSFHRCVRTGCKNMVIGYILDYVPDACKDLDHIKFFLHDQPSHII